MSEYPYDEPTYEAPADDPCSCSPAPVEEVPIVEPVVAEPVVEELPAADPVVAEPAAPPPVETAAPSTDAPSDASTGAWTVLSADPGSESVPKPDVPNGPPVAPEPGPEPTFDQGGPANYVSVSPDAEPSPNSETGGWVVPPYPTETVPDASSLAPGPSVSGYEALNQINTRAGDNARNAFVDSSEGSYINGLWVKSGDRTPSTRRPSS